MAKQLLVTLTWQRRKEFVEAEDHGWPLLVQKAREANLFNISLGEPNRFSHACAVVLKEAHCRPKLRLDLLEIKVTRNERAHRISEMVDLRVVRVTDAHRVITVITVLSSVMT